MLTRLILALLIALPAFGQLVPGDPILEPLAETDLGDFGCTAVSFSATPTFDASSANCFEMTLTGNVTSSTLSNELPGRTLIWKITQNATGGFTFAWPSEVTDACTIASGADAITVVTAIVDGAGVRVTSCGVVSGPDAFTLQCTAATNIPTPASGSSTVFCDSAANNVASKDDGGTVTSLEGAGGGGDSIEIEDGDNAGTFTAIDTTARFDDSGDINFTFADGGAGGPDVVTATVRADSVALTTDTTGNYVASLTSGLGLTVPAASEGATANIALNYSNTLAGNPALAVNTCVFVTSGGTNGFLCEGSTADTSEQLHMFPAGNGADTTDYIAIGDSAGAALTGDSATAFFSTGTVEQARLPSAWDVKTLSFALDSPVTGDAGTIQWEAPTAITITQVDCSTDTGTATIQLDERVLTTPNTAGTDVMSSTLVCDNNNQQTATFANAGIAVSALINMDVDAVASSPTKLRVHIRYTID